LLAQKQIKVSGKEECKSIGQESVLSVLENTQLLENILTWIASVSLILGFIIVLSCFVMIYCLARKKYRFASLRRAYMTSFVIITILLILICGASLLLISLKRLTAELTIN